MPPITRGRYNWDLSAALERPVVVEPEFCVRPPDPAVIDVGVNVVEISVGLDVEVGIGTAVRSFKIYQCIMRSKRYTQAHDL